jgi:O-antigen chain-terminating methyltransferase
MSPEDTSKANGVDVEAILAEVDAAVEAKKAAGFYDPAELRRVEEAALAARSVDDEPGNLLKLHHARLKELWEPTAWGVSTHRAGPAGRLVLAAKKIIHKLSRFPMSVWLARQGRFNDEVVHLLTVLLPLLANLRSRLPQAEKRLDQMEVAMARTAPRIEALLARLEEVVAAQEAKGEAPAGRAAAVRQARFQSRGAAYLEFENAHRGERELIKQRQSVYLPYFAKSVTPQAPLLDLGCGRGEFLEAAKEAGLAAKGLELNPEMVALGRRRGLEVAEGEAIAYLRGLDDGSLGGILMAQLIEHLTSDELNELVSLAAAKLADGGFLIAETVNPACLTTLAGAFYLDLTHHKPIHPEAARFLWKWAGLRDVEVLYLSPYPERFRLPASPEDTPTAEALNQAVQQLNDLLYSYQDYAVVGRK